MIFAEAGAHPDQVGQAFPDHALVLGGRRELGMRDLLRLRGVLRPRAAAVRRALMASALALVLSGCFFTESLHRGLLPGRRARADSLGATQEQVLIILGTPSTGSDALSSGVFYYISQRTERTAFLPPKEVDGGGLFRQNPPRAAPGRLRPQGRAGLRLRQPHHADLRAGTQLQGFIMRPVTR